MAILRRDWDFGPLCKALQARGVAAIDLNVGNYVSLNNEITIKDIAEGLDRAFRLNEKLNGAQEFDAIVHSTGMLVVRSWLTNYGAAVGSTRQAEEAEAPDRGSTGDMGVAAGAQGPDMARRAG